MKFDRLKFCGWGILFVSLLLRAAVMIRDPSQLTTDRDLYLGIASEIRSGHGFATPGSIPPRPTAYRPPLYPLLLALSGGTSWGVAGLHLVMAVVMVIATGAVAARCLCSCQEPVTWGPLAAGAIVAFDPLLIRYSSQPMTETLCSCLTSLLMYALIRERDSRAIVSEVTELNGAIGRPSASQSVLIPRWYWSFASGIMWGLCLLARPTYLVPLGLWTLIRLMTSGPRSIRQTWNSVGLACVAALVVISPWMTRNWFVLGSPIATTTHGGYTLWLANNPTYYTEVIDRGGHAWEGKSLEQWQKETNSAMDRLSIDGEVARDRWQGDMARDFIRANPWRFMTACLHRGRSFWSIWPGRSAETGIPQPILIVIAGCYAALWVSGVWAAWWIVRRGQIRTVKSAFVLIAGFWGVHLVYWTDARMRAPIMPAVAILVSVGFCLSTSRKSYSVAEVSSLPCVPPDSLAGL